ncbi:hypothetical protein HUU05_16095 [candidate division KSB1 bacterium]|nr:hypothetical protein [candidate division KSB1 bacterium]
MMKNLMRRLIETTLAHGSGFERLLQALNPDREVGAREFERRRARLIYVLHGLGCANADELADEVFARVGKKLMEGVVIDSLDAYLLKVARFVAMEDGKHTRTKPLPLEGVGAGALPCEDAEQTAKERADLTRERQRERCMKRCWQRMAEAERQKLVDYFSGEGRARMEKRKGLAQKLDVSIAALRVQLHRLRRVLEECVRNCWAQRKIGL